MCRRGGSLRGILCCAVLVASAGAALAEDEVAPNAAVPADEGFTSSLAKLSELENMLGNGGAEEPGTGILAGYDGEHGFFLRDKTKSFELQLHGRLQARYTYKGRDERGDTVDPGEVGGLDESYFEIERARLWFMGHVLNEDLKYMLMIDGDSDGGGGVDILDAYVLYDMGRNFGADSEILSVGVGQFKPYFLRQEKTSTGKLQMVDRSLTNEFFNIDRVIGAWIQGDLHPIFYSFAVANGFDSINTSVDGVDQIPAFIAKLDFNILGHSAGKYEEGNVKCDPEKPVFIVGLSAASDQNNGTSSDERERFKCFEFGIDSVLKYSIFSLQAEYIGRWLDYRLGSTASDGDGGWNYAHGLYVQGGIFLVPSVLEVTGRVSTIWADGPRHGNGVEAGPGINWYISKNHKVKLQTDLMFFDISANLPNPTESLDFAPAVAGDPLPFESTAAGYESGEQGVMWRTQIQLEF